MKIAFLEIMYVSMMREGRGYAFRHYKRARLARSILIAPNETRFEEKHVTKVSESKTRPSYALGRFIAYFEFFYIFQSFHHTLTAPLVFHAH